MIRILVLLAVLLVCGGWRAGIQAGINKNIITDFGATCNGVANDLSAFQDFQTWAIANQGTSRITLTIPAGKTCCFLQVAPTAVWTSGIKDLVVMGYGATLSSCTTGAGTFFGASRGVYYDNTHQAFVQTATAGDSTVTLVTAAETSLFTSGDWALITGVNLQSGGDPPNPQFHEYVQIASIGVGTITFTAPLRYTYKSTWPLYSMGDAFHSFPGGPATLYVMDQVWNTRQEMRGLTIDQGGFFNGVGRYIVYRDVIFNCSGTISGPYPSQNMQWQAINLTGTSCITEVDKIIDQMWVYNSTLQRILVQSSSIKEMHVANSAISDYINGSPITASAINLTTPLWQMGAYAYGASSTATIADSTITSLVTTTGANQSSVDTSFTMSGGVMSRAMASGPPNWTVPGASYNFIKGAAFYPFTVTDMRTNGSNLEVVTSLAGGFPDTGISVKVAPVTVTVSP